MLESNLTLDCVCARCNGDFGRTIELAYARDSVEAFLRLVHGTKPACEAGELRRDRLSITLGGDDDWTGCRVDLVEEDGRVAIDLVPQVRFARRGGGCTFITEEVLADTTKPLPEDLDLNREIRPISCSTEMDARLAACLARRGIPFTPRGVGGRPPSTPDGRAPLDVEMRFDEMIFRCIAKIAFNYMTAIAEADFTRSSSFDVAREFIRNGTKPPYPLVIPHARPILSGDSATRRQTNGHLLTLKWGPDARTVLAQVSLFNETTYDVVLTHNYDGVWRDLHSGHHFDLETRTVSPLVAYSVSV